MHRIYLFIRTLLVAFVLFSGFLFIAQLNDKRFEEVRRERGEQIEELKQGQRELKQGQKRIIESIQNDKRNSDNREQASR